MKPGKSSLGRLSLGRTSHPSPVAWRTDDGMFFGHDGQCWLYNILPLKPLTWEDDKARIEHAAILHTMFIELGETSKGGVVAGTKIGSFHRMFHLLSLAWDDYAKPPPGTDHEVEQWLRPVFAEFAVGHGLFAVGVKLRRAAPLTGGGPVAIIKDAIRDASGSRAPNRKAWQTDRARVGQILARAGGRAPTHAEAERLESWWNHGRGPDELVIAEPDGVRLTTNAWPEGLEMSALLAYEDTQLRPEDGLWLADAFGHHQGCVAMSARGELVPASTARTLLRKSQRKAINRIKEQSSTGDLDREEDSNLLEMSAMLESLFVQAKEPLIRNCSIVFARRASAADETYATMLQTNWGIRVTPLRYRQVEALEETLPLGRGHGWVKGPFSRDITVGMLAASGVGAYNEVGDDSGVWIGVAPPDAALVWLDPLGASKENKPPSMGIVGEPGAGKTFLLQLIASQSALAGRTVVFINPKAADSLTDFAHAIGGQIITVSSTEREPGMLDPFRYASPEIAADIAFAHINTVMTSITEEDRIYLAAGLRAGAQMGARCVGDALDNPQVPDQVAHLIKLQAQSLPLFGLGIGLEPKPPMSMASESGMTLVEFDRPIPIPSHFGATASFNLDERSAIAAIRLICRAALEQMFNGDGGVLIVDEAHVFLSSQEGRSILQGLGRTGRSQGILPILATQRLADLIAEGVDMSSYMGRSIIMKMTDPRETEAALTLCGLDATENRKAFLAAAGPVHDKANPANSRGAHALYRDLRGRVSAILVGPVPEEIRMRFSTNILDRQERARRAEPEPAGR